ncbi:hypothetical protein PR003_g14760 [Phytophthora rubi]|uniref:Uncharacterized protein n=1 Tax=Phytophthora rubi TaxID=129364 RepID=A0A6A3LIH9_9STRA|nr:hypothetical protein PR001_g13948 [Phytophthora rubi]KAE9331944.1 hypothetical protein PR003_g14760 [Phytophthora rubi]
MASIYCACFAAAASAGGRMASIYCACFAAAASARHSSSRLRSFSIAIPSFSPNASV